MRDLRDPQLLGEALLNELEALRAPGSGRRPDTPASYAAMYLDRYDVPDVTHDDSMQKEAQEAYAPTLEILKEHGGPLDEA